LLLLLITTNREKLEKLGDIRQLRFVTFRNAEKKWNLLLNNEANEPFSLAAALN